MHKKDIVLLENLSGLSLVEYSVQKIFELYKTTDEGFKDFTVGFFRDKESAKDFGRIETHPERYGIGEHFALTDGKRAFLINESVDLI